MSHNGFLCALPTSMIEAIPLGIVSGWVGGDYFWSAGSRSRSKAVRARVGPRLGSKKREASEAS
eukprot:3140820-Pyramimonas_sp.AAC.1